MVLAVIVDNLQIANQRIYDIEALELKRIFSRLSLPVCHNAGLNLK